MHIFRWRSVLSFLALQLIPFQAAAQDVLEHELGGTSRAFHTAEVKIVRSTVASQDAVASVQKIMSVTGLTPNFQIRESTDVSNAEAIVEKNGKDRYILYNPTWMGHLKENLDTSWVEMSVLAHEVGHHLQFHMDPRIGNFEAELQADYFSGFVLEKLGASLSDAQLVMAMVASDKATATHPERARRVKEVARGWNDAKGNKGANVIKTPEQLSPAVASRQFPIEKRIALLFGNSNYQKVPRLKNPKNDVIAIQRELRKFGFSTSTVYDATSDQITDQIKQFAEDAKESDWAIIYYSGNAVEIDGIGYLIPVDFDPSRKFKSFANEYSALSLANAFKSVSGAKKVRLVVSDACRDDPFAAVQSKDGAKIERTLQVTEPPAGVVVAYSTAAGEVAMDGAGDLSPYAEAMIKSLREPGLELDKVFRRVSGLVQTATSGRQKPSTLGMWPSDDLYLAPATSAFAPAPESTEPPAKAPEPIMDTR